MASSKQISKKIIRPMARKSLPNNIHGYYNSKKINKEDVLVIPPDVTETSPPKPPPLSSIKPVRPQTTTTTTTTSTITNPRLQHLQQIQQIQRHYLKPTTSSTTTATTISEILKKEPFRNFFPHQAQAQPISIKSECYYQILGISKKSSKSEIKIAYYKKATRILNNTNYNNNSKEAKDEFIKLGRIYSILKEPTTRKFYNIHGDLHGIDNSKNNDGLYKEYIKQYNNCKSYYDNDDDENSTTTTTATSSTRSHNYNNNGKGELTNKRVTKSKNQQIETSSTIYKTKKLHK